MTGLVHVSDAASVVAQLHAQVQAGGLSGIEANAELREVSALAARLDAYRTELVAVITRSQVWRESNPNATPASFLREEHSLDHHQAQRDLHAASAFTSYPALAEACHEGKVSRAKADLILSIGERNRARALALPEFIDTFIAIASTHCLGDLRKALRLWADQIDPVTTSSDEHDAHQRRELHIQHLGDGVKLDGFFAPAQGLKIMAALNAALTAHHRNTVDDAGSGSGVGNPRFGADKLRSSDFAGQVNEPEEGPGISAADSAARAAARLGSAARAAEVGDPAEYRVISATAAQRADAFIEAIINPMLESGLLPTCGGAPAAVAITIPIDRLANPNRPENRQDVRDRLEDGTLPQFSGNARASNGPGNSLLSSTAVQEAACDATIQRVLVDPVGKPLDIGRRTRVIPEQIRTALAIRDGGCRYPFCSKPVGWTHGHHIRHWSQGGSTSLGNLILLCSRHHHQIHADGTLIKMDDNGIPRVHIEHRHRDPIRDPIPPTGSMRPWP